MKSGCGSIDLNEGCRWSHAAGGEVKAGSRSIDWIYSLDMMPEHALTCRKWPTFSLMACCTVDASSFKPWVGGREGRRAERQGEATPHCGRILVQALYRREGGMGNKVRRCCTVDASTLRTWGGMDVFRQSAASWLPPSPHSPHAQPPHSPPAPACTHAYPPPSTPAHLPPSTPATGCQ